MRAPAVAGYFYPAEPEVLRAQVTRFLRDVGPGSGPVPKAVIAPHAGYVYSGSTAALAYAALAPARDRVARVVLLGPTHRVAVDGLALPEAEELATPLGSLHAAVPTADERAALPQIVDRADVHAQEHSLEVHLPFLQVLMPWAEVVPFAVGRARPGTVADVLERLWGGPETVIVVSSDLSHYLSYDEARRRDAQTIAAITDLRGPIYHEQACGATPVNGLLEVARRRALTARLLGACNSGDTAGDKRRVVGYAAVAFDEPEPS